MAGPQIVLDTNVLVAALRSRRGAAHLLLSRVDSGKFEINLSVPLFLEYEAVCKRLVGEVPLSEQDIDDILNYLCRVAHHRQIFYLWRPSLRDPSDEMVLELAVTAGCEAIVTYNSADFQGIERFGLRTCTPREFLHRIGELS